METPEDWGPTWGRSAGRCLIKADGKRVSPEMLKWSWQSVAFVVVWRRGKRLSLPGPGPGGRQLSEMWEVGVLSSDFFLVFFFFNF